MLYSVCMNRALGTQDDVHLLARLQPRSDQTRSVTLGKYPLMIGMDKEDGAGNWLN